MAGISRDDFNLIFNDFYEPVRNYLFYKSGNTQLAEDITQETFLKIWEKKETIKIETVKSLLYTIAGNLFINHTDRLKVQLKFLSNHQLRLSDEQPADFEMEMKEFDQRLQAALSELDEDKRIVFLMNRIDGFTYVQIAENLGLTVKAIEKRMEKALAFLKKKMNMKL